jgi:tRNA threonylcarbamoyladenosine modification (KEOPS) complex  Pcc1 subunit
MNIGNLQTTVANNGSAIGTLQSSMGTLQTTIASHESAIEALETEVNTAETTISGLQTSIASNTVEIAIRALDNSVMKLTGNQMIAGVKTYLEVPVVGTRAPLDNSTRAASTAYADSAVSTLSSNLQPQITTLQSTSVSTLQTEMDTAETNIGALQTSVANNTSAILLRALDSAVVHLTGAETIGGNKSFSIVPTVGTQNANDNLTRAASTAYADGAVSTLESNLQPQITTLQVQAQNMTASSSQTNLTGTLVIVDANQSNPDAIP